MMSSWPQFGWNLCRNALTNVDGKGMTGSRQLIVESLNTVRKRSC